MPAKDERPIIKVDSTDRHLNKNKQGPKLPGMSDLNFIEFNKATEIKHDRNNWFKSPKKDNRKRK